MSRPNLQNRGPVPSSRCRSRVRTDKRNSFAALFWSKSSSIVLSKVVTPQFAAGRLPPKPDVVIEPSGKAKLPERRAEGVCPAQSHHATATLAGHSSARLPRRKWPTVCCTERPRRELGRKTGWRSLHALPPMLLIMTAKSRNDYVFCIKAVTRCFPHGFASSATSLRCRNVRAKYVVRTIEAA